MQERQRKRKRSKTKRREGFSGGSVVKGSPANAGNKGSIPAPRRGRNWQLSRYSCLENPMDGGARRTVVHGVTKIGTRLNYFTFSFCFQEITRAAEQLSQSLNFGASALGRGGCSCQRPGSLEPTPRNEQPAPRNWRAAPAPQNWEKPVEQQGPIIVKK